MARKRIKRYKVSPDESLCLAVSVVDKPAVESDFQFFSDQKIEKFVGVEGERRMIYGCALRPDFPIYRNDGKEEYYLEFDKDAIDKISKNYFKMGFQSNWTEAHKDEIEGLTITESWIKEDMYQDKSVAIGLDPSLPVGSWFIGCHCENDDVWEKVKENKYHGFSIEAIIGVEEFEKQVEELNSNNNMEIKTDEMNFWNKMKEVLAEAFSKKVDEPVEEQVKEEVNLEEQTPPEPVSEPSEPVNEPEPVVDPQPAPDAPKGTQDATHPEPAVEPQNEPQPVVEAPKADTSKLEELIGNLKAEIEALKSYNDELNDKVKEMGKQPSANPINTNAKPGGGETGVGNSNYQAWRKQMASYLGY